MNAAQVWGTTVMRDGGVRFSVWAPDHAQIDVHLVDGNVDLQLLPVGDGWHQLQTHCAAPGSQYWFVLPDGTRVTDPASRHQPLGVAGPSQVIDLGAYHWRSSDWTGRPWHEAVIYELHVGAFTPEGTFRAAMHRLQHLCTLGVTAIELMPVASFAGLRNWGYDGVLPYAPAVVYGEPAELQALVDTAHQLGLMVYLDVVYNHMGPEGNPLPQLAPAFYTDRHSTPWGAGFSFETEAAVRHFFIQNALHWLGDYRFDGLRLDAVHAIADDSRPSMIEELARVVRDSFSARHVHLIVENENNAAHLLERRHNIACWFDGQWNDDVHHALHVAVTREDGGYYADYCDDAARCARAIAQGFAFQGELMPYRNSARGEPSAHLPPTSFISFLQNHDQIGNRAFGERLHHLASPAAVRAASAVYLLLPQIPMLFMGEEWASSSPFLYFCDFQGELGHAVKEGRRTEFAAFAQFTDPVRRNLIPDPLDPETFAATKLDWHRLAAEPHVAALDRYRKILAVRHRELVPLLPRITQGGDAELVAAGALRVRWNIEDAVLLLHANLSAQPVNAGRAPTGRVLWREGVWQGEQMGAWAVHWCIGDAA